MPKHKDDLPVVIEGYAQALLSVAKSEGAVDRVEEELTGLRDVFSANHDLISFLKDPKVTEEGKRKAVSEILGDKVSPLVHFQIALAIEQGRAPLLPAIIDHFFSLTSESRKKITAKVTTAIPLSESATQKMESTLSELVGEAVFLKMSVDPDILGGIMVHLGDRIIDGSLKGQLDQLREGISRKILTEKGRSLGN
ncbi:ATP synthase delta chain [hydrothermal vent metagenome]|uniref:ATP synthase delta chain n=1 Tax=hydrothermal vent metagenome TaxID=652676 RepID=A0A3B1D3Y4_9ZZZZ